MTDANTPQPPTGGPEQNMSKEELMGFHKGSLNTLAKERQELTRLLNIVEQLMHMHINGLKELGVDLEAQGGQPAAASQPAQNMDDLLK